MEPTQAVYHTDHSGTETSQHPAEFARQLSRQYEALSYLIVDEYLKGHNLYNTQKRAPTPPSLELQREDLERKIVSRLVGDYRFDPNRAEKKVAETMRASAVLHEPDQFPQGTHQLVAGEIVQSNSSANSSIGGQHKVGFARLDEKARDAQIAGKGYRYSNTRMVPCDNSRLISRVRHNKTDVVFDPKEYKKQIPRYTRADRDALVEEIRNKYSHLLHGSPQPTTALAQLDNTGRISQVKNILAAVFPEPATPTRPHITPTRSRNQPTGNYARNHPQNQVEQQGWAIVGLADDSEKLGLQFRLPSWLLATVHETCSTPLQKIVKASGVSRATAGRVLERNAVSDTQR